MTSCQRCGRAIDRELIAKDLRTRTPDNPETCQRAAEASVFCSLTCALEDFAERVVENT